MSQSLPSTRDSGSYGNRPGGLGYPCSPLEKMNTGPDCSICHFQGQMRSVQPRMPVVNITQLPENMRGQESGWCVEDKGSPLSAQQRLLDTRSQLFSQAPSPHPRRQGRCRNPTIPLAITFFHHLDRLRDEPMKHNPVFAGTSGK